MSKKTLISICCILIFSLGFSQNNLWQETNENRLIHFEKKETASTISEYKLFSVDLVVLKNLLSNAADRFDFVSSQEVIISFPDAAGEIQEYAVYEAPVLHPDLGAQFPEIKSYVGFGIDDKTAMIRFSVTLFGFHGMIFKPGQTTLINPYTTDLNHYIVFDKKVAQTDRNFECLTEEDVSEDLPEGIHFSPRNAYDIESNTGIFRTYRLALACTEEYSQYHINQAGVSGGTLAQRQGAVLAAMNVTITRVNGVYERDMSLTMQIIPNNLPIIFLLPENPDTLNNNNGGTLLNQIQAVVDAGVGFNNYDIGHVFSTGGGGIAQLYSPCSSNKARGVTGSNAPVGDAFDIDYVAHEMGHQYGATHTQNNNCSRSTISSVEPGSASTIMGYAGICSPNVQFNSDSYFHTVSLAQMDAFVASSGNCSNNINNNNTAPFIQPLQNYIIPRSTPFVLKGNATDEDNDALTYCWEQTNTQVSTQPPQANSTAGPNFRSRLPVTSPDRYMPMMTTVLTGATANTWEVVPSVGRTMDFALTVRDNRTPNGGQTARENMTVTTVSTAGPFLVTTPNIHVTWQAGSNQTVTWDVAGTTSNGVDTPFVDIYLSTNGGGSFPILLASQVPNDGSEIITIPNIPGSQNRIMVMGHNNIFFDVSNSNFSITAASTPTMAIAFNGFEGEQNKSICQGGNTQFNINYLTIGNFSSNTTFSASGQPSGVSIDFNPQNSNTAGTIQMNVTAGSSVTPGLYAITATATSGSVVKQVNYYLNILNSNFSSITLNTPANGETGVAPSSLNFNWQASSGATAYDLEIATDSDFNNIVLSVSVPTNSYTATDLPSSSNLYWRVRPKNDACSGAFSSVSTFNTIYCGTFHSTNVPVTIPTTASTIQSTLTIPIDDNVTIDKITVDLNISHTWINDVIVTLISPAGTQIQLMNRECPQSGNYQGVQAVFDDAGSNFSCQTVPNPAISGVVLPQQPLSGFNGQNSQGVWTLRVQDIFNQDGGTLNNWSLTICSPTPPLSTDIFENSGFTLYPNPNSGTFTIQMPTVISDEVSVEIYDMRGRNIFNQNFVASGNLLQEIRLGSVQSGVYLAIVTDGINKQVKRVVIE